MAEALTLGKQHEEISPQAMRRSIFRMVWPATLESTLQMAVGMVAMAMIGHVGPEAVGAVGLSTRVTQIVWAIFAAIGTGATVLIARAVGAGDKESARRTAEQALVLAVGLVCLLTVLVVWQARWLMVALFRAEAYMLDLSFSYLALVAYGMPFMAIMQVVGAIMRGAGNTRTPMVVALFVNIINICANYILIFGRFGFPAMGMYGAAIAAIVAQSVGALLALYVWHRGQALNVRMWRLYRPHGELVQRILKIGIPAAGEMIFWQVATIILMRLIVTFGTAELAAHQLGLTAESLSYMPAVGFGIAATAFVGQSLGAEKPWQAARYVAELVRLCLLLTVLTASLLFFIPETIMRFLTQDAEVVRLGAIYLSLMAIAQFPQQMGGVLNGALRGAGDTKIPMYIGGFGLWLVRLPLAFILSVTFGLGITGVWVAMTVDLFVRFGLSSYYYYRGHWQPAAKLRTERVSWP
ncbi:MAG: putative FMN/FAD exporter YeeO [Firmicutes bacterium]|nr:putative FMN/FAD exporter YeeO [Bacillota bacterium]